jgi:peptide/nickel transport system substrate-binding protein
MMIIPDASTQVAAMRTAKIDSMSATFYRLTWEDARQLLQSNPQLKYLQFNNEIPDSIAWRVDKPELPFYDIRVRQALNMAIDRQKMNATLYGGMAEILQWPVANLPEFKDAYIPLDQLPASTRELFEYQPDKAKQLLVEAGYPKGFATEVVCSTAQVDLYSVVKDYWAKIGVDLKFDVRETAVLTSIGNNKAHKEMIVGTTVGNLVYHSVRPGSTLNKSMIDDPRVNAALAAIDEAFLDVPKKNKIVKELTPYLLDQAYFLLMFSGPRYNIWQPWVKGYEGEVSIGYANPMDYPIYVWMDQDLKKKMTGLR